MKNSVKLFSAFMAITMLVASSIGHVSADSALASPSLTATSNSGPFTYTLFRKILAPHRWKSCPESPG